MGLDMYLINATTDEKVAYWRKSNQIHAFFDRELGGLEDCERKEVDKELLIKLRDTCKKVLDNSVLAPTGATEKVFGFTDKGLVEKEVPTFSIVDNTVAKELLPTQEGFFFGDTAYNNWYIEDVSETYETMNKILKEVDFDTATLEYYAWW